MSQKKKILHIIQSLDNDAFDVLATPKSNYYYKEKIEQWFADASLKDIRAYEHPEAGITCIGIR